MFGRRPVLRRPARALLRYYAARSHLLPPALNHRAPLFSYTIRHETRAAGLSSSFRLSSLHPVESRDVSRRVEATRPLLPFSPRPQAGYPTVEAYAVFFRRSSPSRPPKASPPRRRLFGVSLWLSSSPLRTLTPSTARKISVSSFLPSGSRQRRLPFLPSPLELWTRPRARELEFARECSRAASSRSAGRARYLFAHSNPPPRWEGFLHL